MNFLKNLRLSHSHFPALQEIYILCFQSSLAPCDIFLSSHWLLWFLWFWLTTFHRKQSKRDSYRLLLGNIHTDARGTKSSHFHVVNLAYTKNPCCLSAFIYSEKRLPVPGIQFVNRTAIVNGALVAGEQKTEQGLSFFHSLLLSRRLQSCSVLQTKLLEQATKTLKKQTR